MVSRYPLERSRERERRAERRGHLGGGHLGEERSRERERRAVRRTALEQVGDTQLIDGVRDVADGAALW